ncbi:MAG TPA: hypothetical protein VHW01_06805 [Polyangiaceae bacterium]|jgi:hypothetical protein|nr:hypothetical protein [Polyangiaceae bacterium]
MQKLAVLVVLAFSLLLAACGGSADSGPAPAEALAAPSSCEASPFADAAGDTLWTFSDKLSGNPLPGACTDLGDGIHFWCDARACLFLPYTGSCPHCPGGGE